MNNKSQLNQAVIYCHTEFGPERSSNNPAIIRREDACLHYADKHNIEVLKSFHDSGTKDAPQSRLGFTALCHFLSKHDSPLMVLIPNSFSLSFDSKEISDCFYLLEVTYGAVICDIASLDGSERERQFKQQAETRKTLLETAKLLTAHAEQCSSFSETIEDLIEEQGDIQ